MSHIDSKPCGCVACADHFGPVHGVHVGWVKYRDGKDHMMLVHRWYCPMCVYLTELQYMNGELSNGWQINFFRVSEVPSHG